jgi:hypothetical protein
METLMGVIEQARGRQRDFLWKSRAVSKHSRISIFVEQTST